jgi:hypothetical protein
MMGWFDRFTSRSVQLPLVAISLIAMFGGMILFLLSPSGALFTPPNRTLTTDEKPAKEEYPRQVASDGLPNAYWVHENLLSGGVPQAEVAFNELARMGIQTIISVDGIHPRVELAQASGMRYVHLPIGYNGISMQRSKEIAKAIRDFPKPIYIHCHHGRHRGPTAAAVGCILNGWLTPEAGEQILRTAGTNPAFEGLYRSVQNARPETDAVFESWQFEFVSIAPLPPLIETMVSIDECFDKLKQAHASGWSDENLEMSSEALMLKEHFAELHRTESVAAREPNFVHLLSESARIAEGLESQLKQLQSEEESDSVKETASRYVAQLGMNCTSCHSAHRDYQNPEPLRIP